MSSSAAAACEEALTRCLSACNGSHMQWVDDRPVATAGATGPRLEAFFNILLGLLSLVAASSA